MRKLKNGLVEMTVAEVEREFIRQGSSSGRLTRIVRDVVGRRYKTMMASDMVIDGYNFLFWSDFRVADALFRNSKVVFVTPPIGEFNVTLNLR